MQSTVCGIPESVFLGFQILQTTLKACDCIQGEVELGLFMQEVRFEFQNPALETFLKMALMVFPLFAMGWSVGKKRGLAECHGFTRAAIQDFRFR